MFKFLKKNKDNKSKPDQEKSTGVTNLFSSLNLTRKNLASSIKGIFTGKTNIDSETLEQLEAKLLTADIGVKVTQEIITELKKHKDISPELAIILIKKQLEEILQPCNQQLIIPEETKPFVILLVGVNGSG